MSHNVLLLVTFPCREYDEIASLAKQHLDVLGADLHASESGKREAIEFLSDAAGRTGPLHGQNGGVYSWGIVGNYVDTKSFVNALKPFFSDLLDVAERDELEWGPHDFQHVLVFVESEQVGKAKVFDIYRPQKANPDEGQESRLQVDLKTLCVGWEI